MYRGRSIRGQNLRNSFQFETRTAPREGAYVHGMFMEGARWDIQSGIIMESRLKELFPAMPVINIRVSGLVRGPQFNPFMYIYPPRFARQSRKTSRIYGTCTSALCTKRERAALPMCGHSI